MATFGYVNRHGEKIEREYPCGSAPKRVRHRGGWYERDYTLAQAPVVSRIEGIHSCLPPTIRGVREVVKDGPDAGKVAIRNRQEIREIEAANPGLKFNPEYYHDYDVRRGR